MTKTYTFMSTFNQSWQILANALDNVKEDPLYDNEELESHVIYKFKNERPFTDKIKSGIRIKEFRKSIHITQKELANILNTVTNYI